jgi:DNA replication protein DnaC
MACKEFHMKQLNNEQKTIVDNILHKKTKIPTIPFHIFLIGNVGIGKNFTLTCIIQTILQYYITILQMLTKSYEINIY